MQNLIVGFDYKRGMRDMDYWRRFENTGSVEDYLSYRLKYDSSGQATNAFDPGEVRTIDEAGGKPYAGIPVGDRNDIKTDSCR